MQHKATFCDQLKQYQQEAQLSQRDRATLRVKSLKVIQDHLRISRYWYSIETISVSRTVSEILSVKEWRDLETWGMGRSKSSKMAPFDRSYTTIY